MASMADLRRRFGILPPPRADIKKKIFQTSRAALQGNPGYQTLPSLDISESPALYPSPSEAFLPLSSDTTEALLPLERQTSFNRSHHEENPGSAPAKRVDEAAIEIVEHCLSEKKRNKRKKRKKKEEEIVGHSVRELSTSGSPQLQSLDTTEALLQSEWQTSLNRSHHEENPGSAPAERFDEVATDMVEHSREEVATEGSIRVEGRNLSTDTTEALLPSERQTSLNRSHYEENPGSAPAENSDQFAIDMVEHSREEVAIDMVEHSREEVATEGSIRVEERSLLLVAPDNPFDVISRPEIHDRNPKVFGKRFFVIGNFLFEILGSALSQASSPNKPEFALAGLVMSLVAVIVCIIEFGWKAQRAKVTMRRRGWIWWFHHPPPHVRLFGTFAGIFGLTCAILQLISSAIDFGFFQRHADNPVKISLYPVFFAACVVGSEFINNHSDFPTGPLSS